MGRVIFFLIVIKIVIVKMKLVILFNFVFILFCCFNFWVIRLLSILLILY